MSKVSEFNKKNSPGLIKSVVVAVIVIVAMELGFHMIEWAVLSFASESFVTSLQESQAYQTRKDLYAFIKRIVFG